MAQAKQSMRATCPKSRTVWNSTSFFLVFYNMFLNQWAEFISHSGNTTKMPTMIIIITSWYSVYPMHHASKKYPQLPQVGSLEISRERSDLKTKPLIAMWDPDQEFLLGSGGGGIKPNNSLLGIINKETIYVLCMVAVLLDANAKCTCKVINKFYDRK